MNYLICVGITKESSQSLFNYPPWDWVAVIVAILSFVIASFALGVATKTLKSQRQTEKNTTPIMTTSIQKFLLKEILIRLFCGYMKINTLKMVLEESLYQTTVSKILLSDIKIDEGDIHVELFYDNDVSYRLIRGLLDEIRLYNRYVDIVIDHQEQDCKDKGVLEQEMDGLLQRNGIVADVISKVMGILYNYKPQEVCNLLLEVIKNTSHGGKGSENKNRSFEYQECEYAKLFESSGYGDRVTELLDFMKKYSTELFDGFAEETDKKQS